MNVVIIGASGYSGAELASLVAKHPTLSLTGCYVSAQSLDKHKLLSELYPEHLGLLDLPLQPLNEHALADITHSADYVCLCTDHKVSVDLAPQFLAMGKRYLTFPVAIVLQVMMITLLIMVLNTNTQNYLIKRLMVLLNGIVKPLLMLS